jgi:hypothetical protein
MAVTVDRVAGGEEAPLPSAHEAALRGIFEAIVLLLVVRVAEPLFFGEGYYSELSLHPYWIVVILASVQGGSFVGIVTAAMAAMLIEGPPRPVGVDITAYYIDLAVVPVQWLIAAILIGSFRQGQIRREAWLLIENERLRSMSDDLAAEVERMDGDIAELELKAATASQISAPEGGKTGVGEADAVLASLGRLALSTPEDFAARLEAASRAMGCDGVRFWPPDGPSTAVGLQLPLDNVSLERLRVVATEGGCVEAFNGPARIAGVGDRDRGALIGVFFPREDQDGTVIATDDPAEEPLWRMSILAAMVRFPVREAPLTLGPFPRASSPI